MSPIDIVRHADPEALAEATAARFVTAIVEAQAAQGSAQACLTGGRIGTAVLASIAASSGRDSIDWSRLDLWWGDERFVDHGDPERNDTGADAALLTSVGASRIHRVPGPAESGGDVDRAAELYAESLAAAAWPEDHSAVPAFDVLLLSIGPDGHVASLFPELPALHDHRSVVAVRGAPKPPPTRVTLTLSALNCARQTWVLASGAEKATAVRLALSTGAGSLQVPAAGIRGRERTLWLVDDAAAALLSTDVGRPGA